MDGNLEEYANYKNAVRIRGLPFSATEKDIRLFFAGLEVIPNGIQILLNSEGLSSGQAIVHFLNKDIALKALHRQGQHMGSRYIEIFQFTPSDAPPISHNLSQYPPSAAALNSAVMLPHGRPGMPLPREMNPAALLPLSRSAPSSSGPLLLGTPESNQNLNYGGVVRVRGLPQNCSVADIVTFFRNIPVEESGVVFVPLFDGRPSGEAFVEFKSEESSIRALQMDRERLGSRTIDVFRSTKGEMMAVLQHVSFLAQQNQLRASLYPGGGARPMPMRPFFHDAGGGLQVDGNSSFVRMRGLPITVTKKQILEYFEGIPLEEGNVCLLPFPNQEPMAEAIVEFPGPNYAHKASQIKSLFMGSRYIDLFRVNNSQAIAAIKGVQCFGGTENFSAQHHSAGLFPGPRLPPHSVHLPVNHNSSA